MCAAKRPRRRRPRTTEEESAGGIVVRRTQGQVRVLLIKDSYRNWGFPKGHLEAGETAESAALREVREETGLDDVRLLTRIETIDWHFRFRGRLIHKTCHFYLMESPGADASPQRDEGITACRWEPFASAESLVSYDNAREVLRQAAVLINQGA